MSDNKPRADVTKDLRSEAGLATYIVMPASVIANRASFAYAGRRMKDSVHRVFKDAALKCCTKN